MDIEAVKDDNRNTLVAKLCSLFNNKASGLRDVCVSDGDCTRFFLNYHPYIVEKFQEHPMVKPYVVDVWDPEEISDRIRDVLEVGWTVSLKFVSDK